MKTILIPTDFSITSLDMVEQAAKAIDDRLTIVLFHAFDMPGSLLDAMIRSSSNGHYSLITEHLRVKCRRIKAANPNIGNISFKFMYGTTNSAFNNFASANNIDAIVVPENYYFMHVVRESVNPLSMFKKSRIEIISDLSPSERVLQKQDNVQA